jgi:hypothetical protein
VETIILTFKKEYEEAEELLNKAEYLTTLALTKVIKYRIIRRSLQSPKGYYHFGSVITLEKRNK